MADNTGTGSDRAESPPRGYQASGGLVPVPDPTLLTTQSLQREIAALKELFTTELKSIDQRISEVSAYSRARNEDIRSASTTLQALLEEKIDKLSAVCIEKFAGVGAQFAERDTRTDQRAGDTKLAVDAAFAAAKEATAKIEAGFTKQIDGMTQILDSKTANLGGNIDDLKQRMTAVESRSGTQTEGRRDNRDNVGLIVAIIAAGLAAGSLFLHFPAH
jgi:hypothetical protein